MPILKKLITRLSLLTLLLFFSACSISQNNIKSIAQTSSASNIENYKNNILKLLIKYKEKLDKRNPFNYNKSLRDDIINEINTKQDYINILQGKEKLRYYKQYLYYAFSKDKIKNRNDFLILGIYKLIYTSFAFQKGHQFAAWQYNKEDMIKLYEYLQIIRWKIRQEKDNNDNYLFKTWQNNWQLELLAQKNTEDLNVIKNLKYIKDKKETIFDHSNFSFEIILSKILLNLEYMLKEINIEPYELGVSALTSFVFIL